MINDHYNVDRLHVSRLQVARERMVLRTSLELILYVLYIIKTFVKVTEYRDDDEIVLKILEICFELKCFKLLIHYHFV